MTKTGNVFWHYEIIVAVVAEVNIIFASEEEWSKDQTCHTNSQDNGSNSPQCSRACIKIQSLPISGQPVSSSQPHILRTTDQSHGPSGEEGGDPVVLLHHPGPGQNRSYAPWNLLDLLLCPTSLCCHPCSLYLLSCLFSHLRRRTRNS